MDGRGNTESIREAVSSFTGSVPKAYVTILELKDELGFDLDFNFNAANGLQRFTTMVRNMIQRKVIGRPIKSGRSSILNETTLLQILVSRKYLNEGCGMGSLAGYLTKLSPDDLYDRLFAKQLPDIDKVASRISADRSDAQAALTTSEADFKKQYPVYYYIKVKPDLFIHVKSDKYRTDELEAMVSLLAEYLDGRTKSES